MSHAHLTDRDDKDVARDYVTVSCIINDIADATGHWNEDAVGAYLIVRTRGKLILIKYTQWQYNLSSRT